MGHVNIRTSQTSQGFLAISHNYYSSVEQMGKVTIRSSLTSQGSFAMNPWLGNVSSYEFLTINKGNNPLSKIEIVSSLNSFNLARWQYYYDIKYCPAKYNPKVYLGAVQSASPQWNFDKQNTEKWTHEGDQKSGSWPPFLNNHV